MAWFRPSFASSLALVVALLPAGAMAQSILPTTAYNMQGAAETLASSEEHGITGRLNVLREGDRLATRRMPSATTAPFTDMQKSNESLHDLRPTSSTTSTHKLSTNYKLYNPAVYRDAEPPKEGSTWVQRQYDELMRKTSIGGGAANATTRMTQTQRQRIVPNLADRVGKDVMEWTAGVGSAGAAYATATGGMPRHTMMTLRESQRAAISQYRGQPLSNVAKYENAPPPVIYDAQNPPPASYVPPQDSMTIRQAPNYAVALGSLNEPAPKKKSKFIPFTKPTDTGTYLWSDEQAPAPVAAPRAAVDAEDETPLFAQEPINPKDKPSYGAKAVPLSYQPVSSSDTRWGTFVSGITGYGFAKHQETGSKAKTVRAGFTAGGDYRLMDKSYIGAALTYIHSTFTTGSNGELKANSTALSLYGTTDYATDAYVAGYISLGYHALDSERTAVAGTARAKADPDGFQFTGKVETGYDFKNGNLKYGPYAGLRMGYATFGDYTETGAGANNLNVDGVDDFSTIASLGVGGSHPFAMSNGGTFLPALRLAYNHEFGDRRADVSAVYADGSGALATPDGAKKDRDWISLAPSLTAALANNWTFQLQYAHDFFRDFSSENVFNLAANYKW